MASISDQMAFIQDFIQTSKVARADGANKAETRHKIINTILHDILSWPKNRVSVEEYVQPGFADFVLKKENGDDLLFIEAKREGIFFELPRARRSDETHGFVNIAQLHSDANIKAAMTQVRSYCIDTGCEFAGITNGHEWVFFKVFEKGKRWDTLKAFVIRDLRFFGDSFTKAINHFSYNSIVDHASLMDLLTSIPPRDRETYFVKERIPSYSHSINANRLANFLRPIVNKHFGVIGDGQKEFMSKCYVTERDYAQAAKGMRSHIQDSLTPYFQEFGVTQLDDEAAVGGLGGRLTRNIEYDRHGEVLILFGGKGSGKSTFIRRLLHHSPPKWLKDHSKIAIVDLLKVPEDKPVIRQMIWGSIVRQLDTSNILSMTRDSLLKALFYDRYEVAQKQDLAGISEDSQLYHEKLNSLVAEWKSDLEYCLLCRCLLPIVGGHLGSERCQGVCG